MDDFDACRGELLQAGCFPHRGPLVLDDGRRICQVRDPFGTIWGLEQVDEGRPAWPSPGVRD